MLPANRLLSILNKHKNIMRKYYLFVIAIFSMIVMTFTSCKKTEDTFPLNGTVWMASELYDLYTNRFFAGDVMYVMKLTGAGTGAGTMMTIDNHTKRGVVSITPAAPVSWTSNGNSLNVTNGSQVLKGDLSYANRNVNFLRANDTYLAFDQINLTNALATKVFKGTFTMVGSATVIDCVWIFLSGKGWKMMIPDYPAGVDGYPLGKYTLDNSGAIQVEFFGGTASSAVPIDFKNHGGTYTVSSDSLTYTTTNVPTANQYPLGKNWRGVFRLKEVK